MSDNVKHEWINDLLDGRLTGDELIAAQARLAGDPEATKLFESFRANREQLASLPNLKLGDDFSQRVMAQIEEVDSHGDSPHGNSVVDPPKDSSVQPVAKKLVGQSSTTQSWDLKRIATVVSAVAALFLIGFFIYSNRISNFDNSVAISDESRATVEAASESDAKKSAESEHLMKQAHKSDISAAEGAMDKAAADGMSVPEPQLDAKSVKQRSSVRDDSDEPKSRAGNSFMPSPMKKTDVETDSEAMGSAQDIKPGARSKAKRAPGAEKKMAKKTSEKGEAAQRRAMPGSVAESAPFELPNDRVAENSIAADELPDNAYVEELVVFVRFRKRREDSAKGDVSDANSQPESVPNEFKQDEDVADEASSLERFEKFLVESGFDSKNDVRNRSLKVADDARDEVEKSSESRAGVFVDAPVELVAELLSQLETQADIRVQSSASSLKAMPGSEAVEAKDEVEEAMADETKPDGSEAINDRQQKALRFTELTPELRKRIAKLSLPRATQSSESNEAGTGSAGGGLSGSAEGPRDRNKDQPSDRQRKSEEKNEDGSAMKNAENRLSGKKAIAKNILRSGDQKRTIRLYILLDRSTATND